MATKERGRGPATECQAEGEAYNEASRPKQQK